MEKTSKGLRLHIGLFGRRNAGKSSLLNALAGQPVAIVSDVAGTTTDTVEKAMELLPIGPVVFLDTAGIDDTGDLGALRVERTRQAFDRSDIGILVVHAGQWGGYEDEIVAELQTRTIPFVVAFNHSDKGQPDPALLESLQRRGIAWVQTIGVQSAECRVQSVEKKHFALCTLNSELNIDQLREALVQIVPDEILSPPPIVSDLIPPGATVVLVVPIDREAPKGRLILPQVQTIRDLLDGNQVAVVCKDAELAATLGRLNPPPSLVVTDSQAYKIVAKIVPPEIPLTSFSVLFARQKGDLTTMINGARAIAQLKPGSRVLIAEACTHHAVEDDIGRVKIPAWLRNYVVGDLHIENVQGHNFPNDSLADWDLVIHCGACLWNRREILSRMMHCRSAGVPITNYGLAIAFMHGILDRAVKPFQFTLLETATIQNSSRNEAQRNDGILKTVDQVRQGDVRDDSPPERTDGNWLQTILPDNSPIK
ncbi:MAG: [FeFe] hydrogenase H-cluster maturation GTPase HydF [Planctomycetaceae bacterium]|nr:[FeFe] hydrogenase H-cluster maturation GTPase HydF [Planctomycetaceae bacterium]